MASLTVRNLKPENAQAVDGLPGLSVPDASLPLPLPPAPATRAAQPARAAARQQRGGKDAPRERAGAGACSARRTAYCGSRAARSTAGPGPRDLPRVQGREIYRGSRAARSTAGPEPGNLLRVRELEITLGEFLDIDVLERHNLNVLHKTRRTVHIPHPGVLHDNLEEDLTVVGGPDV